MNMSLRPGRSSAPAIAMFGVLLGLSFVPVLSVVAVGLLPFPLVVLRALRESLLVAVLAVVAALVLWLAGFALAAGLFAMGAYFIGFTMGDTLQRSESPYPPLLMGTLAILMMELVLLAMFHWAGADLFTTYSQLLKLALTQHPELVKLTGQSPGDFVSQATSILRGMLPAMLVILAFIGATINLTLARTMLRKSGLTFKSLIEHWRLPEWITYVYIISLVISMLHVTQSSSFGGQMVNAALILSGFFIGIQGFSWIIRRITRPPLRSLLAFVLLVVPLLIVYVWDVYVLLGIIDIVSRRNPDMGNPQGK